MNKLSKLLLFSFLSFFCLGQIASAQVTDLSIEFTGTQPAEVLVGSAFAITGRVFHVDANSTNVPGGETVIATVELKDPDGQIISTHIQTWDGFTPNTPNPELDNDDVTTTKQVIFSIPWSQAQKWTESALWSVTIRVQGAALENNPANNQATHTFSLVIPNLQVTSLNTQFSDYLPGSDIYPTVVVRNDSAVRTQEGVFFPLVVRLLQNGTVIDEESVVLPFAAGGLTPSIEAESDTGEITMPPLRLPADASLNSTWTIQAVVDPAFALPEHIIHETIEDAEGSDNRMEIPISVDPGNVTLTVDQDSFYGDTGTFNGLDPVRISFSIRHSGTSLLSGEFTARVLLSEDDSFTDNEDFILREFNVGQSGLGANLRPNETIHLDWIQQLPDNLEGDYYLGVTIANQNFPLDNTPVITLVSENNGITSLVTDTSGMAERPHTSKDGRFVVYEQTDFNGNQQIYYQDLLVGGSPTLISNSFLNPNTGANGDSLRPRISGDGSTIVFHSIASNLVPGDGNNHEDVFLYKIYNQQIIRAEGFGGNEANEGSFYPDINQDGNFVVFESDATNLNSNGNSSTGRQIFLWDLTNPLDPQIKSLTQGNKASKTPKIDDNASNVVFVSDATDLSDRNLTIDVDTNGETDVFLLRLENNYLARVNRPSDTFLGLFASNIEAMGGPSDQVEISGDGETIVFRSEATNLLLLKGISNIRVDRGGVGYFGNPSIVVTDSNGTGSGAILSLSNGINSYGQIQSSGVKIVNPGINYVDPIVSVIPDPNFPAPRDTAVVTAFISHPEGDIYRVKTADVLLPQSNIPLHRVSEKNEVGGNMPSREPSISEDGRTIVYATKSSNLLDSNVTRSDGRVYFSNPTEQATATAILVGGIGEIEIQNPGLGYQNGFLKIEDFSGNGSGAIASYQVDTLGRISSILMVSGGENYDLDTTIISVDNPRGGTGFEAGAIRFEQVAGSVANRTGGALVHRVEMVNNGAGYQEVVTTARGLDTLISIQGDGVDIDQDGYPDAKIDQSKIHIGSQGEVFLEQSFDVEILSTTSLANTTLTIADKTRTIAVDFALNASTALTTVGYTASDSLTDIRDRITNIIRTQWAFPESLLSGPQIENNSSGGTSFTFSALTGKFTINNPSSILITPKSNMLFSGFGFTRATPVIAPSPSIFGFSEVLTAGNIDSAGNNRPSLTIPTDNETDDIYLFDLDTNESERVSLSSFGFPVNYIPSTASTMPSNRFPIISGDGRHIFFSSDAEGEAGLAFTTSNQNSLDGNSVRDIYHRNRQLGKVANNLTDVRILFPSSELNFSFGSSATIPVVVDVKENISAVSYMGIFVDNDFVGYMSSFSAGNTLNTGRYTYLLNNSNFYNSQVTGQGTHEISVLAFDSRSNVVGSSSTIITMNDFEGSLNPTVEMVDPVFDSITSTSTIPLLAKGSDADGNFIGVQFYVNGQPEGKKLFRASSESPEATNYTLQWSPQQPGNFSFFALGWDNSGNYVSSDIYNISSTTGSDPPAVEITKPFKTIDLNSSFIVLDSTTGSIIDVNLTEPIGSGYFTMPKVSVTGLGTGAKVIPIVDWNISSLDYGKITKLTVESSGQGYDLLDTSIRVTPVVQSIKLGEEASISTYYELNASGDLQSTRYYIGTRFDGKLLTGSGYVTAPKFRPRTISTPGRLPLEPPSPGETTTNVLPLDVTLPAPPSYPTARISGGFNHSPLYLEANVSSQNANIAEVRLSINGEVSEESVKTSPPYVFPVYLDDPMEYSIVVLVKDDSGNISSSEPLTFDCREMIESSPIAFFEGPKEESLQVGSTMTLTTMASSESGINNVEFFLDAKSLGFAEKQNDSNFYSMVVDLKSMSEGPHEVSLIARDFLGNQVGSFPDSMTNIQSKLNKILNIRSASNVGLPNGSILAPKTSTLLGFQQGDLTSYEKGSIVNVLIKAESSATSEIAEIKLFSNGRPVDFTGPNGIFESLMHDPQSTSHELGYYEFSFEANTTGTKNISVTLIDNYGNQNVIDETIKIEVIGNQVSTPSIIKLVSPYKSQMGSTWISGEQDLDEYAVDEINKVSVGSSIPIVAFAIDEEKDFQSLRFFVDDTPLTDEMEIPLPVSFPDHHPFSILWEANETGIFNFYAMGKDKTGNISISNLSTVQVMSTFDQVPDKPYFTGNRKLATATATVTPSGGLSIELTNGGNGYVSEPKVIFENFGTGGSGASAIATIDPLSRQVTDIKIESEGNYTTAPQIYLQGGFVELVASGAHAAADLFGPVFGTSGVSGVRILSPGFGYSSAPNVTIVHPTGIEASLSAIMEPSPLFGLQVAQVIVDNPGQNYSPLSLAKIAFSGGLGVESESFEVAVNDSDGTIIKTELLAAGGGFFWKFEERTLPPFKGEWSGPAPGEYHLFSITHDNLGNISTSQKIVQDVIVPQAPVVSFAPLNVALATPVLNASGGIDSIRLDYNGSGYNSVPKIFIDGDGEGAEAVASLNYETGQITKVDIAIGKSGSGYTHADIYFMGGLEKGKTSPEVVLGETISVRASAMDPDGQVVRLALVIDGDKVNPKQADDILDPQFQPGSFQYNGSDPEYIVQYTPNSLGFIELMIEAVDDEGKITYSNPLRYKITNGSVPTVEMITPMEGSKWSIGYDQNRPIRLVADARDPDWAFNNDVNETSKINGVMFFANDRFAGEGQRIPFTSHYSLDWLPKSEGVYKINAYAIDSQGGFSYLDQIEDLPNVNTNRGNITVSAPIELEVIPRTDSKLPIVDLVYPSEDLQITSTSEIRLVAAASDPDDSVETIQFFVNGEPYGAELSPDKSRSSNSQSFAVNWSPEGKTGIFSLMVRAKDASGNLSFSSPVILSVSSGNNLLPTIELGNLSDSYQVGSVVNLFATGVDEANSSSTYGVIEEVRFFVNGALQGLPDEKYPYLQDWRPENSGIYDLFAQVRDNENNVMVSPLRSVEIEDVELISFNMADIDLEKKDGLYGLYDGSTVSISVSADGESTELSRLNIVSLYANGKLLGNMRSVPVFYGNGILRKISYTFEWNVDYANYADKNGQILLIAVSSDPDVYSNAHIVNIFAPDPYNPAGIAGALGVPMNSSERARFDNLLAQNNQDPQKAFVAYINQISASSLLSQYIDIVAAHKISLGYFHKSYASFLEAKNFIASTSDQWLRGYIDYLLFSPEYQSAFGPVPYLVGAASRASSINYSKNRRNFVQQCFQNKYSKNTTFQQLMQGSSRMLSFWENYEPGYWEIRGGRPDDSIDSPPRRDAMPIEQTGGDNNFSSGNLTVFEIVGYLGPEAGHCAVDLIFNLSKEYKLEGGLPYILGSDPLRDNVYKIVVLLFILMEDDLSSFSSSEISRLSTLSFDQAMLSILRDYRYQYKFNQFIKESKEVENSWKETKWFGYFVDTSYPWIYHIELGWLYYGGATLNGGFWLFSDKLGWLWSDKIKFSIDPENGEKYRLIYQSRENTWIGLVSSGSTPATRYYSYNLGEYISF